MRSIVKRASPSLAATTRIVCLPGAYHSLEDFLSAGFEARVDERRLPVDLEFVDVELQHLGDIRFRERLKHDIVAPARAAGCRSLWFAGISLGGFLALDYAASYPEDLDGLCLLAPYLGSRLITDEITRAGGLAPWVVGPLAEDDTERRIWGFIQTLSAGRDRMYLGYGQRDRFADAQALLAGVLPANAVRVVAGGHDWPTWTTLWELFLASRFA